jgi:predicted aldo/keto reductase-like oxidoreductase
MKKHLNRRTFIKNTSLGAMAGPLLIKPGDGAEKVGQNSMAYKTLGRTGFEVTDIGVGYPSGESVLRAALKSGLNYIDTAEQYGNGNHEKMVGKVIQDFNRKKLFITTKIYEQEKYKSKEDVIDKTRKALDRLQTDYVDCMMLHSAENTRILKDKAFHSAMDQLKAEGRVKFVGVSCHGSAWYLPPEEDLETVLMAAENDGRFDVFLMTYNFVNREKAERVLRACSEKKIGTIIMKSNPMITFQAIEGYINRFEQEGTPVNDTLMAWHDRLLDKSNLAKEFFGQYGIMDDEELVDAAIQFVISNPDAHSVCLPFKNLQDLERWTPLSGKILSKDQTSLLEFYRKQFGDLNCRFGCRECASACPHDVQVSTIMRYNYYFQNKGREKYAMEWYGKLEGSQADVCSDCPGYCEEACPDDVLVRPMLAMAHDNLINPVT